MSVLTTKAKAAYVKERVSMYDVIERYHHHGRRKGRTACPFHGGENDNLGYDKTVFHCFVCGESGDTIDFVMRRHNCDFVTAMRILDTDFHLGLEAVSDDEKRRAEAAQLQREIEREESRRKSERNRKAFILFVRYRRWLERRKIHTSAREFQLAWADRQCDFIMDGGDYRDDAHAAIRASVHVVREAERNG